MAASNRTVYWAIKISMLQTLDLDLHLYTLSSFGRSRPFSELGRPLCQFTCGLSAEACEDRTKRPAIALYLWKDIFSR